jgi:hypothetical protein
MIELVRGYKMTETFVRGLRVVVATKGRERQFWVAATPRDKATAVVQKRLQDGWKATLTDQQITVRQAHKLTKLRLNGACQWEPDQQIIDKVTIR